jgi:cysteine desulfurase
LNRRYYFDWAATAPPDAAILQKIFCGGFTHFANPSSRHCEGRAAKAALEEARRRCAAVLGVDTKNIFFTSGATESNAVILFSMLERHGATGGQSLISSEAEHPSIAENCRFMRNFNIPVLMMKNGADGAVSPAILEQALQKQGAATMLALMLVNNETGAINDLQNLVRLAREKNKKPPHIHSDIVQAAGKINVDLKELDVDSAALSAHKIGGPRGTGLLYLRKNIIPLYRGGGQESGVRPGTENVDGALCLAECLEKRADGATVEKEYQNAEQKMSYLVRELRLIERCVIIPECRKDIDQRFSPYILQAAFKDIPGEVMVRALDGEGFALSTGSACSSKDKKRPVLAAMGVDDDIAFNAVRISIGWSTTADDIDALLGMIKKILERF